jgi:hypothetical protein
MNEELKGKVLPIDQLKLPKILYKYRHFDNKFHLNSILQREIYIPSAKEFNDPYDSKIPFRYREEDLTDENIYKKCLQLAKQMNPGLSNEKYEEMAYRMQKEDSLRDAHHLEKFDKLTFERLCNDYGIYCLTPDAENLLMWSYYGDSHRGFCIGYNSDFLVKCGLFGMGGEVLYRDDFPKLPLFLTEDDHPMLDILFTKWNKWIHEDEYRLVHSYKHGKIFTLPKEAINEIVIGCQISDHDKILNVFKIKEALPDVKIFQIEQNNELFGLRKVPVFDKNLFIL